MSFKDIISLPGVWITTLGVGFVAVLGYIGSKKENKAKTEKTQAEKEKIKFDLQVEMDTFESAKEARYDKKIDDLNKRLDEQDFKINEQNQIISGLRKIVAEYKSEIEELKAINNLYQTVKS